MGAPSGSLVYLFWTDFLCVICSPLLPFFLLEQPGRFHCTLVSGHCHFGSLSDKDSNSNNNAAKQWVNHAKKHNRSARVFYSPRRLRTKINPPPPKKKKKKKNPSPRLYFTRRLTTRALFPPIFRLFLIPPKYPENIIKPHTKKFSN